MARKLSKKKRQQHLEDSLVDIMMAEHEEYLAFIQDYSEKLTAAFNEAALLAGSNDVSKEESREAITSLIQVLGDYRDTFKEMLVKTSQKASSGVLGQDYFERVVYIADEKDSIEKDIEEAYDYFEEIFISILLELEEINSGTTSIEAQDKLITNLVAMRERLVYFLRRHVEAQMSLIVNLAVIEASQQYGVELWKWNNRPELTESGTCDHCKSLAVGGLENEGIYTLETLPLLPVHPHCVCVVIPLIP